MIVCFFFLRCLFIHLYKLEGEVGGSGRYVETSTHYMQSYIHPEKVMTFQGPYTPSTESTTK